MGEWPLCVNEKKSAWMRRKVLEVENGLSDKVYVQYNFMYFYTEMCYAINIVRDSDVTALCNQGRN